MEDQFIFAKQRSHPHVLNLGQFKRHECIFPSKMFPMHRYRLAELCPVVLLERFKEQMLYCVACCQFLYFFDLMLKAVLALLFTAAEICLIC